MKNARPDAIRVDSVEPEELTAPEKVAKQLGVTAQTLANWRSEGSGPRFVKVGRLVYYRRSDVSAWLAKQLREPGGS